VYSYLSQLHILSTSINTTAVCSLLFSIAICTGITCVIRYIIFVVILIDAHARFGLNVRINLFERLSSSQIILCVVCE
jgi:hypothetical protein